MKFKFIEVIKTQSNFHYIEWDVLSDPFITPESVDDYKFYIYHSEDPATGFAKIEEDGDPVEVNGTAGPLSYTHNNRQYNFDRDRYYKVEMVEKADESNTRFSAIAFIGDESGGYHENIRYAEEMMYNHYYGEPSYVIKKKGSGARCPECWSPYRQQRTKSYCETCNSSGFVNGYFAPIALQIAFDANPKISEPTQTGEKVTDVLMARSSNYPLMSPKDIVINKDDYKRYVVNKIEVTKLPNISENRERLSGHNYVVSQILTLIELTASDQEYFINIDGLTETITENVGSDEGSFFPTDGGGALRVKDPLKVIDGYLELRYEDTHFDVDMGRLRIKQSILDSIAAAQKTEYEAGSSETKFKTDQHLDGGSAETEYDDFQTIDGGTAGQP